MIRTLLNHRTRMLTPLLSVLAGELGVALRPGWLGHVAGAVAPSMFGNMLALLGFVVTALALVMAVRDRGVFKVLGDHAPQLMDQLMSIFINTAWLVAAFALYTLVCSQIQWPGPAWSTLYLWIFATGIVWVVFQVAKLIYILESAAQLANKERQRT